MPDDVVIGPFDCCSVGAALNTGRRTEGKASCAAEVAEEGQLRRSGSPRPKGAGPVGVVIGCRGEVRAEEVDAEVDRTTRGIVKRGPALSMREGAISVDGDAQAPPIPSSVTAAMDESLPRLVYERGGRGPPARMTSARRASGARHSGRRGSEDRPATMLTTAVVATMSLAAPSPMSWTSRQMIRRRKNGPASETLIRPPTWECRYGSRGGVGARPEQAAIREDISRVLSGQPSTCPRLLRRGRLRCLGLRILPGRVRAERSAPFGFSLPGRRRFLVAIRLWAAPAERLPPWLVDRGRPASGDRWPAPLGPPAAPRRHRPERRPRLEKRSAASEPSKFELVGPEAAEVKPRRRSRKFETAGFGVRGGYQWLIVEKVVLFTVLIGLDALSRRCCSPTWSRAADQLVRRLVPRHGTARCPDAARRSRGGSTSGGWIRGAPCSPTSGCRSRRRPGEGEAALFRGRPRC